jgi:hypothetical protein
MKYRSMAAMLEVDHRTRKPFDVSGGGSLRAGGGSIRWVEVTTSRRSCRRMRSLRVMMLTLAVGLAGAPFVRSSASRRDRRSCGARSRFVSRAWTGSPAELVSAADAGRSPLEVRPGRPPDLRRTR